MSLVGSSDCRPSPATDDLGVLGSTPIGCTHTIATAINNCGQVVGWSGITGSGCIIGTGCDCVRWATWDAFRTAPNSPINPATDDLGTFGGAYSEAYAINASGQVVGVARITAGTHAFRTAPNSPINPATDDLGAGVQPTGINDSGQVVGIFDINGTQHAFRTAPNSPINPATDDLGTFGGPYSYAYAINASGQAVGYAWTTGDGGIHAFRTAPNSPINPATDDLGVLGGNPFDGTYSIANAINNYGQVVGYSTTSAPGIAHAFLYDSGVMYDLNNLIPAGLGYYVFEGFGINDVGQIAAQSSHGAALLLIPVYKAFVQQPINADSSSVFNANRGVVPVKFRITQYGQAACASLPATIAITRTSGGTLAPIDENTYSMGADSGSNFRIDDCKYSYNISASALGVGTYRVDISINGIMVGHAVFALK